MRLAFSLIPLLAPAALHAQTLGPPAATPVTPGDPAQTTSDGTQQDQGAVLASPTEPIRTLPNLSDRSGWPEPTADSAKYSYFLVDLLEYQESRVPGAIRWDMFGWYGGDVKRLWIKTEGTQSTSSREGSEQEAQLLYGQLITPFFDAQAGVRYAHRSGPGPDRSRVYAVIGLQGLAPYRYELEPALFVSEKGQISARVTATYDLLLSQRLILQPRLEFNAAVQKDSEFEMGSGLVNTEMGARLRYEIRREFAPYIGISWKQSYGSTRRLVEAEGNAASVVSAVAGVRMWF